MSGSETVATPSGVPQRSLNLGFGEAYSRVVNGRCGRVAAASATIIVNVQSSTAEK